jgi:uncharacterized protein (TIGR03083 family)
MTTLGAYVPVVQSEVDGLAQFLDTLSADEWQHPSACDLWTVRDVVAHLIWAADFYTDTVSRGIQGDISHPEDRPPGNAPEQTAMPEYFNQQTIKVRDRLGAQLMPTFRASFQSLSDLMSSLSPQQWEMPCSFFRYRGGQLPAQAFLFLIIQELSIHGWDVRSRFDETASLSEESLPLLMERIPRRLELIKFPIGTVRQPLVRYQFDLRADSTLRYDVIVKGGNARMEPSGSLPADVTLLCDQTTFALMAYNRLTLQTAVAQGRLTVEGEESLVAVLEQGLNA